jgi:hypothetical protein
MIVSDTFPSFETSSCKSCKWAGEVGLVKLGTVAVDGSKANASEHKAMSYGRVKQEEKRLRKETRELMGKARRADTQSASDIDPLIPLLDAVEENLGTQAGCNLADAGDRSESKLPALEDRGIDGYGATGRAKDGKKPISPDLEATRRMARKLRTKRGEKTYRKRKRIGEPPFSWIQSAMGFDPFHLRGVAQHDRGRGSRVSGCEPAPDAA